MAYTPAYMAGESIIIAICVHTEKEKVNQSVTYIFHLDYKEGTNFWLHEIKWLFSTRDR